MTTPNRQLPPEWAPQNGVMLTWPHRHGDWQPWLSQVEPVFANIAFHITTREQLLIACYDDDHRSHVEAILRQRGVPPERRRCLIAPSNDTWARDHGPITVIENGQPTLLDFTFNGWGGKYASELDNSLTRRLAQQGGFSAPLQSVDLVLEGGSIESDGEGTLLTTEQCLLSPGRNPHLSKQQIEQRLGATLGVQRILWLQHGYLAGDDTDSHIDTLVRICNPDTLCYVSCNDRGDEHYSELKAMEAELRAFRNRHGHPYRLVPLPMPAPKFDAEGQRLPATYANFLIINGAVLVPTYRDENDALALAQIARCFPHHEIVAIDCLALVVQYGSLHCVTMQLPQGTLEPHRHE